MSTFDEAICLILDNEGGYVNHPNDPGGETKYGISKASHPGVDIKNLTLEQAKEIYKSEYWLTIYEEIHIQLVANKIFDIAVNIGTNRAHYLVQWAICGCLGKDRIKIDGKFGPKTLHAVNTCGRDLLHTLRSETSNYYRFLNVIRHLGRMPKLLEKINSFLHHEKIDDFYNGWINRAYRIE